MQEFGLSITFGSAVLYIIGQAEAIPSTSLWTFAANLGLSVALVIFFVLKSDKRENRLIDRLTVLEKFGSDTLIKQVTSSEVALRESVRAHEGVSSALKEQTTAMNCMIAAIGRLSCTQKHSVA